MLNLSGVIKVGKGVELKNVNGTPVLEFRGFSMRKVKGERQFDWIRLSYWGKGGESVAPYVVEGKRIAFSGDLQLREYVGKDGSKRTSAEVRVSTLELQGEGEKSEPKPATESTYDDSEIPF